MLELKGLHDDHPAAVTATFGLLTVFPDARISFKEGRKKGGYHACIHDLPFKTVNELSAALADKEMWGKLIPLNEIEKSFEDNKKDITKDKNSMPISGFNKLIKNHPDWAAAIVTDHITSWTKEDAIATNNTPFYPNLRRVSLSYYLHKWIYDKNEEETRDNIDVSYIASVLSSPVWEYEIGFNFQLFPEIPLDAVFQGLNGMETVPILCLLSVVNWLNCPVYVSNGQPMSPLWSLNNEQKLILTVPVFTKPVTRRTMTSWFMNQDMEKAKSRTTSHFGIAKVNRFGFKYHSTDKKLKTLNWNVSK